MKDRFGNYVVQKGLETCDDECKELLYSRIMAHEEDLKNYTYGKHIVSRVEKLIETGGETWREREREREHSLSNDFSSLKAY